MFGAICLILVMVVVIIYIEKSKKEERRLKEEERQRKLADPVERAKIEKQHKVDEENKKIVENFRNSKDRYINFIGETVQPIGKIPAGSPVILLLKDEFLEIRHMATSEEEGMTRLTEVNITLPYDRITSFRVNSSVELAKSGTGLGGAVVGDLLFGGVGAIVGQQAQKGKTNISWIGTLLYNDKNGNQQQLVFIYGKIYIWGIIMKFSADTNDQKSNSASQFETKINKRASECSEDIKEL